MSLLNNLLIQPLVLIYDILFTLIYGLVENPVLSIVILSIVINFIVLPLYCKADAIQKAEQEKAKKMKPWIDHIQRQFSGDERFMILSAYYKIEHYSPASTLKEAGPLLLQIPFFIAAYRYISSIPILERASFGLIHDLLKPDGLVTIAGFSINILPILMTVINIASSIVYSKGGPLRLKIQIYGTALVFLVLLYDSPSGLVLYWIMNNLFSLGKNVYYAHKPKDKTILPTLISVLVVPLITLLMIDGKIDTAMDSFLSECILACALMTIIRTALRLYHMRIPDGLLRLFLRTGSEARHSLLLILLPELVLTLLFGLLIPSSIIASSPIEFTDTSTGVLQSELLSFPAMVFSGLFLVWTSVIILSRDDSKREMLTVLMWCISGVAIINQFVFPVRTGTLYTDLSFDGYLNFPVWIIVLNIFCCLLICAFLILLYAKKRVYLLRAGTILSLSLLVLSLMNYHSIVQAIIPVEEKRQEQKNDISPITLTKTGTNVVVMMLDRAIGGYVPYIFDEFPGLEDSYEGFIFYPDTVSFGPYTNFGAPGLFGGYDYTPYVSNKRDTVSLKEKHNEALKLMPLLFSENGYDVSVCDPPYANYQWTPDLSIFDDMPNVRAYNLNGVFSSRFRNEIKGDPHVRQRHNFLIYPLFRISPLFMKNMIYDGGNYITINRAVGFTTELINTYSVLAYLNDITTVIDDERDQFIMFQNETPHNPTALNPPDYAVNGEPAVVEYQDRILNGRTLIIRDQSNWGHYCINIAVYKAIAKWLDYLKEQGVYNNTRIILVSDHGRDLRQFEDMIHPDGLDIESLNPLLMVKDFNAGGDWTISNDFMTNADVPIIAMKGVIKNPTNPFTGQPINDNLKNSGALIVTDSENWQIDVNNGNTFDIGRSHWWAVHDSIFDMDNWEKIEEDTGK